MRTAVVLAITLSALSACASPPDRIKPIELPETAYMDRSCEALSTERTILSERVNLTTSTQKKAANADAMGVFLVGLPVNSMVGGDRGKELAVYSGQLVAVDSARAKKRC